MWQEHECSQQAYINNNFQLFVECKIPSLARWVVLYPSWTIVSCMLLSIILSCVAQLKPTLNLYTPLNAEYSKYLGLKCISCM